MDEELRAEVQETPGVDQPWTPSPQPPRRSAWLLLVAIVALGFMIFGIALGTNPGFQDTLRSVLPSGVTSALLGKSQTYPMQREVLGKLGTDYFKQFDPTTLENGAVRGMVAALGDPYTSYFDPTEYATFKERTDGRYSGVGMVVEMKGSFVTVVQVFKGGPGDKAGLKSGDVILGVGKEPTQGLSLEQVVAKIKGPSGTKVTLQVYHLPAGAALSANQDLTQLPPGGQDADLTLERQAIDVPVVDKQIKKAGDKTVAYVTFSTFSEGSAKKLREAVDEAVVKDNVQAIVLDLRDNGGGLLLEAVDVASIFLPTGVVVVTTEGLHSPKQTYVVSGGAVPDIPLYVLTNGFTASASEIVSGALKDYKRATLVGGTTFGKGLVQTLEPLSNGGALKVTTAVYLTPNGEDINKKGIEPDVAVAEDTTGATDPVLDRTLQLIGQG